ncbi:twin-arginine translocation pathway signal [Rhodococcus sp. NPDC058514]|uniref:twin-arginine translocation pathway signal n=1 Tax=unclassified Rhodococcus (in: high G+C Gram-positive bacteria) TaxID=192944 RepID=UPI0036573762
MSARRRLTLGLTAAVLVLTALAGFLYITAYRPDQRIDDGARAEAQRAAADGAVALLTYTPETAFANMAAARELLTGDFRDYHDRLARTVIVPAAMDKKISATATVTATGMTSLSEDSAAVLVFLDQSTTTPEQQAPTITSVGAEVELQKVDGRWLISAFDAT